jgi:hypothetical protein
VSGREVTEPPAAAALFVGGALRRLRSCCLRSSLYRFATTIFATSGTPPNPFQAFRMCPSTSSAFPLSQVSRLKQSHNFARQEGDGPGFVIRDTTALGLTWPRGPRWALNAHSFLRAFSRELQCSQQFIKKLSRASFFTRVTSTVQFRHQLNNLSARSTCEVPAAATSAQV